MSKAKAKKPISSRFYHFSQNNSGGRFVIDDKRGLGPNVWIEAIDERHATSRAEDIGIYFNGCQDGIDCDCCGDRWYPPWDGQDAPELNEYSFHWHDTIYVHRLDGTLERIKSPDFDSITKS